MSRAKRTPRARTVARQKRVASERLVEAQRKLLDLSPGGSRARPLDVATASVIEPMAKSTRCPRCDEPFELLAHEARADGSGRLREVKLSCRFCAERRSLWFRIGAPS